MPRYPALDSLWSDAEHLSHAEGIGIYAAKGHRKVVLDQVSEVYTRLKTPKSEELPQPTGYARLFCRAKKGQAHHQP